jgi:UDP-N-acetylglucosamine--N-acetylmuramyl-(pentapeptide) pyrophosphoryl-undecaprenol N-acetylglucosamine transferase
VRSRRDVVIAGGGTGGHIVPALQIARELVARGRRPENIELYGSKRGQEAATWDTLQFPYTLLPGRGIRRSLEPSAVVANIGAVAGLAWACARALASFVARRPRVVVVVGGYASFPPGLAAVLTRVPLVCVTTDSVPGAVNRFLGRFAAANAVAFESGELPRAQVTGTPVRPELHPLDRSAEESAAGRTSLGLPQDRWTVAAFGGSLGARRINDAVAGLAKEWASCADRTVFHVTGRRDFADYDDISEDSSSPESGGGLCYRVVPFEERMADLYAAADVCVTRAGAMTVAELLMTGVPAVLVPLPGAPRDHQTRNAQALVSVGSAVLLPDVDCDGQRLAKELDALLSDPERLHRMNRAAREHSHPDAAKRVVALVDAQAR